MSRCSCSGIKTTDSQLLGVSSDLMKVSEVMIRLSEDDGSRDKYSLRPAITSYWKINRY